MALECHMKQLIKPELQARHIELCQEYRKCYTIVEANATAVAICAWWYSSGGVISDVGMKELNDWLSFWHFCYHQWGSDISQV